METRTARRERSAAIKLRDDANAKLKIQNKELREHINHLEKMIEGLVKENCSLIDKVADLRKQYEHECKVNDSLIKHSYILFEYLANSKGTKSVAFKPTPNDLELFFKDSIANGTKD